MVTIRKYLEREKSTNSKLLKIYPKLIFEFLSILKVKIIIFGLV